MTTYVQKKERMFREAGDIQLQLKRSFARIKRIESCSDRRAWTICNEERRQHILEILKSRKGLSLGTYVPIEALINILLGTKNLEIERLQKRIEELEKLLALYDQLELTDEQKRKLQELKAQMFGGGDSEYNAYGDNDTNDILLRNEFNTTTASIRSCAAGRMEPDYGYASRVLIRPEDLGTINLQLDVKTRAKILIELTDICPSAGYYSDDSDNPSSYVVNQKSRLRKKS